MIGFTFYLLNDTQKKYDVEHADLYLEKVKLNCKLNNGYYKFEYNNESMSFMNNRFRIYDSILVYHLPHPAMENKLEWTSERIFTLKSKGIYIDSITKEVSFNPRIQTFEITDCKKDTFSFIEINAVKYSTENNGDLSGRIIRTD